VLKHGHAMPNIMLSTISRSYFQNKHYKLQYIFLSLKELHLKTAIYWSSLRTFRRLVVRFAIEATHLCSQKYPRSNGGGSGQGRNVNLTTHPKQRRS